jgi:hypothetical protein
MGPRPPPRERRECPRPPPSGHRQRPTASPPPTPRPLAHEAEKHKTPLPYDPWNPSSWKWLLSSLDWPLTSHWRLPTAPTPTKLGGCGAETLSEVVASTAWP